MLFLEKVINITLIFELGRCFHAEAEANRKGLHRRRFHGPRAARDHTGFPETGICRGARAVGLRQDDAPEHHRRAGSIYIRRPADQGPLHAPVPRPGLGFLPQPLHRLRVPELQPDPASDGPAERGAGADALGRLPQRTPRPRQARAGARGTGRPAAQEAESDVRRPDAACGHRACAGKRPGNSAGRRADRRAGLGDLGADHGAAQGDFPRKAHYYGHAQSGAGRALRHAHHPAARRRGRQ